MSVHQKWACFSDVPFMNLLNKVHRPPCRCHWGSTNTSWTKHHRTRVPIFVQTLMPGYNRKKMLQDLELLRLKGRKDVHNTHLRHQWASHLLDLKARSWLPSASSLCPPCAKWPLNSNLGWVVFPSSEPGLSCERCPWILQILWIPLWGQHITAGSITTLGTNSLNLKGISVPWVGRDVLHLHRGNDNSRSDPSP